MCVFCALYHVYVFECDGTSITMTNYTFQVGPGTGLAPMRALLQEREHQANNSGKKTKNMTNILFFGCKNAAVDYIYRDELEAYEKNKVLHSLRLAFSRDTAAKVYVQHLITEPKVALQLIDLLFNENAYIYVCGATLMGTDVHAAFVKILTEQRGEFVCVCTWALLCIFCFRLNEQWSEVV